ncbi:acetyl-CoA synthetase [Alsobacter metallidurans]|uniref:Acetyl-CoA synthetase n=1 Tax=Alsobacter metallidurans TaxID=340221 RepID=A0A917I9C5_9HYPH|nr:benzoate-CoA ligase family protein [Alsobacter metallidurans]GGH22756.1 acetyl-CoA synthetase [Alsobacter metallidurans]
MTRSAHVDTFTRENLPPPELQPDFLFTLPELQYPERLNAVTELLDNWLAQGHGDAPCIHAPGGTWTYADLAERVNRIANVLVGDLGLVPGNRVLLRSANTPMLVAAYLAILKAGGVVVATMPLLRARELAYPIAKAKVSLALCDARLLADLETAQGLAPDLKRIVAWGDGAPSSLESLMAKASPSFAPVDTAAEDCCLIGFTSGTTGEPKGTMHNHRDLLAICDAYGRQVLKAGPDDVFIGSPPLAFTFGLGGLVLFPLRAGASSVILDKAGPDELLAAIERFRATISFTAPTAYRAMLGKLEGRDISSLRRCVSAGESLPAATFEAWRKATGIPMMDGIGATEMLHIFIAAPFEQVRAGATGTVVPGYEARIIDDESREVARGTPGRLAVRGPTGCRYLADERQRNYVKNGWNVTGDTFLQTQDGYFVYQARTDDMIISSGYNIAGPEVEASLLAHPAVAECGVVGAPDEERGMVVRAYVVLREGVQAGPDMVKELQDFVKRDIAPYKYPRSILFVERLPRTETGKLQRFALRQVALAADPVPLSA